MRDYAYFTILAVLSLSGAGPVSAQVLSEDSLSVVSRAVVAWADSIVPDSVPVHLALPRGSASIELGTVRASPDRSLQGGSSGIEQLCRTATESNGIAHCSWPHDIRGTFHDFSGGVAMWIEDVDRGEAGGVEAMVRMMWVADEETRFPDWEILRFRFTREGGRLLLASVSSVSIS